MLAWLNTHYTTFAQMVDLHDSRKFAVRQSSSKEVTSRFVTGVPLLPLSHYTLRYSIYLAACSVCRLNVPENTPIQSITRSARAHWQLTPILDMLGLEASRIDSRSLGNSWHRDFAALTESVYKLELLPVALYDADDQKATTCTARRWRPMRCCHDDGALWENRLWHSAATKKLDWQALATLGTQV